MENITVFQNIGHMFSFLAKKSSWQADRARRIFDNGCPKERVKQIDTSIGTGMQTARRWYAITSFLHE